MIRLLTTAFICLTVLMTAPIVHAHGTERHFGTSLDERPTFKSSPAFLEMVIGVSYKRAIKHVQSEPEKLASDLTHLVRYTAELATTQSGSPEFVSFSQLTVEQAEWVHDASRKGRDAVAIDGIKTLQREFQRLRPKIQKKKTSEK